MSYKISTAIEPGNSNRHHCNAIDWIKNRLWLFSSIRKSVSPVARTVSYHGRNETATLAKLLHNLAGPGIESNKEHFLNLIFSFDMIKCPIKMINRPY